MCLAALVAAAFATAVRARPAAALAIGGIAWLFDNGFVVHGSGDLHWDGRSSSEVLGLLVGCATIAALLGNRLRSGLPADGEVGARNASASRKRQDRQPARKGIVKGAGVRL
jgi:hypothetical protein